MNKLCCLIIMFIAFGICKAQTPSWIWAKSAGGVSNDYSNASCSDANGNVYITGTFQGPSIIFGNDTLHNNATGTLAIFIAKYDENGNVLWARSGGGSSYDYTYGICTDVNNNVFIEGYSGSPSITFDTVTLNNSSTQQVFIVKYDSMGNVQWGKNGKGSTSTGYVSGWGICSDLEGNVYLYGNADGPNNLKIIFDNDTLAKGAFIVKYDGGGNVLWAKRIATDAVTNNREQSMCADILGNIYLTGAFEYSAIFENDTLHAPDWAIFIAKYDSSGNKLWVKSAYGSAIGNAIASDVNCNIYLTGYFGGFAAFGNDTLAGLPFSNTTIFIAKYDSSGNALWGRTPGGSGFDFGQSICTDVTGNVFVTGYFISSFLNFGGNPVVNSFTGNNDAFIAAYDGNGYALWAKSVGNQGNDYGMGICTNALGDIYLTGYFESYSLNFNSNIITNSGSADVFIAKLGLPTSIEENSSSEWHVFPNPFTDKLTITTKTNDQLQITLYDIISRKLLQQTFTNSTSINTEQLSKGIYLYEVKNKNGIIRQGKIVKD